MPLYIVAYLTLFVRPLTDRKSPVNRNDTAKTTDKPATASEIEAEEREGVAIFARRLDAASGKASRPDYVPPLSNPVTRN